MGAGYSLQLENKSTELGMPAIQQGYLDGLRGGTNLDHATVSVFGFDSQCHRKGAELGSSCWGSLPLVISNSE